PRSTNFFGRVGFPVLIANTVNWLTGDTAAGPSSGTPSENEITPGDALLIQPLPRATRVQVITPRKRTVSFDGNQPVRFLDTATPGAYVVTQFVGNVEI